MSLRPWKNPAPLRRSCEPAKQNAYGRCACPWSESENDHANARPSVRPSDTREPKRTGAAGKCTAASGTDSIGQTAGHQRMAHAQHTDSKNTQRPTQRTNAKGDRTQRKKGEKRKLISTRVVKKEDIH